jgi:AmmeMemoRadiSam system protein A
MRAIGLHGAAMAAMLMLAGAAAVEAGPAETNVESRPAALPPAKKESVMIKEHRSGEWTPGLTDEEKATLFAIAEDTLNWCVNGGKGKFPFEKYTITERLKKSTATFVTLKIQGMLRGCIGSLAPVQPLYESVHENAVNAAQRDFRFRPVTPAELKRIEVDVSILSPIADIKSLDEFHLGEHGIIIEKGRCRAVYLPEVAIEQKWTRDETLASLSEKAGMDADAWRKDARFKIFSSVVLAK